MPMQRVRLDDPDVEPTDEQLAELMAEVMKDVRARGAKAQAAFEANMRREAELVMKKWGLPRPTGATDRD